MKKLSLILLTSFLLTTLPGLTVYAETSDSASGLEFENMWIAEAPPVSKVLAAYLTIKNSSNKDKKIVSAKSDDFGSIQFHLTIDKNGMASMQHLEYLNIPAGSMLTLKPGDYHMMLFKPARRLSAGDTSNFQFQLDNGNTVQVTAIVKKNTTEDPHQHHNH